MGSGLIQQEWKTIDDFYSRGVRGKTTQKQDFGKRHLAMNAQDESEEETAKVKTKQTNKKTSPKIPTSSGIQTERLILPSAPTQLFLISLALSHPTLHLCSLTPSKSVYFPCAGICSLPPKFLLAEMNFPFYSSFRFLFKCTSLENSFLVFLLMSTLLCDICHSQNYPLFM